MAGARGLGACGEVVSGHPGAIGQPGDDLAEEDTR